MSDEKNDKNPVETDADQAIKPDEATTPPDAAETLATTPESETDADSEAERSESSTDETGHDSGDWMETKVGGYSAQKDYGVDGETDHHSAETDEVDAQDHDPDAPLELEERPAPPRMAEDVTDDPDDDADDDSADGEKPYWMEGADTRDDDIDDVLAQSGGLRGSAQLMIWAFLIAGGLAAAKIWLANRIGLGDAEAYYWSWSKTLSLSYFDHPPAIAWLIHLGNLWLGETLLGVRIVPIILVALMTLLIYDLAADIAKDRRVGLVAAMLLGLSPVFFVGGAAATPDAALGACWLLAIWLLRIAFKRDSGPMMVAVGVVVGLGLLSKYFMVLFWPLVLIYLLLSNAQRHWLGSRWLWIAIAASAALFSPVIVWNAGHDWASFTYHLIDRNGGAGFDATRFWLYLGGQAVYLSPLLAVALLLAALKLVTRVFFDNQPEDGLLFWLTLPVLALFFVLGAWTPTAEPHWPLIGYLMLFVVLSQWLVTLDNRKLSKGMAFATTGPLALFITPGRRSVLVGWLLLPALLLNGAFALHMLTDLGFIVLPDDERYNPALDISNELLGWPTVGEQIGVELQTLPKDTFLASYHYTMCGQLAFATRALDRQTACLSPQTDAYDFMPAEEGALKNRTALIVTDNRYSRDPRTLYACSGGIRKLNEVPIERAARVVRTFTLWRCDGYQNMQPKGYVPPSTPPQVEAPQVVSPQAATPEPGTQPEPPQPPPDPRPDSLPIPAENASPQVESGQPAASPGPGLLVPEPDSATDQAAPQAPVPTDDAGNAQAAPDDATAESEQAVEQITPTPTDDTQTPAVPDTDPTTAAPAAPKLMDL